MAHGVYTVDSIQHSLFQIAKKLFQASYHLGSSLLQINMNRPIIGIVFSLLRYADTQ